MTKVRVALLLAVTGVAVAGVSPAFGDRIEGTVGDDVLRGTGEHDSILGYAGNDRAYGRGGRDWVAGGDGDDRLFGGSKWDDVIGREGDDVLNGGLGDGDEVWGGFGADVLRGGPGKGVDYLTAGAGDDSLFLGRGVEQVEGNRGNDRIHLVEDGRRDYVDCGRGKDDVVLLVVTREPDDTIRPSCERIIRPVPGI